MKTATKDIATFKRDHKFLMLLAKNQKDNAEIPF